MKTKQLKAYVIYFKNKIQCFFSGHDVDQSDTCPFTGKAYLFCKKCKIIVGKV